MDDTSLPLAPLLHALHAAGADSLQFRVGNPPLLFVGSAPTSLSECPVSTEAIEALLVRLLTEAERQSLTATGWLDTLYLPTEPGLDRYVVRVRHTPQGPALALRPAPGGPGPQRPSSAQPEPERAVTGSLRLGRVAASAGLQVDVTEPERADEPGPRTRRTGALSQGATDPLPTVTATTSPLPASTLPAGPFPPAPLSAGHLSDASARGPHPGPPLLGAVPPPTSNPHHPPPSSAPPRPSGDAHGVLATERHGGLEVRPPRRVIAEPTTPRRVGADGVTTNRLAPLDHAHDPVAVPVAHRPLAPRDGDVWSWPSTHLPALLLTAMARRVSDIVVSAGNVGRFRHRQGFEAIPGAHFNSEQIIEALGPAFTAAHRAQLERTGSADLALQLRDPDGQLCRLRVNVFRQLAGLGAAFRPIWDTVPDFAELLLPPDLIDLADLSHGLVLVCGPTGSGKSTTLSTMLEHINRTQQKHIITLEDPIEYVFRSQQSLIHQREVGHHVDAFDTGLRAALREAPDVIMVGEMRDLETVGAALTAGETGHLVLSTLHAGTAQQAIDRLVDIFPEAQQGQVRVQLSDVLRAVVTQRLLPRIDGHGRVPAVEIVRVTYAVSNLIRERKTHQLSTTIQSQRSEGMRPLDMSLLDLCNRGLIARDTALRVARDRRALERALSESP